jgi:hypothetical protein
MSESSVGGCSSVGQNKIYVTSVGYLRRFGNQDADFELPRRQPLQVKVVILVTKTATFVAQGRHFCNQDDNLCWSKSSFLQPRRQP